MGKGLEENINQAETYNLAKYPRTSSMASQKIRSHHDGGYYTSSKYVLHDLKDVIQCVVTKMSMSISDIPGSLDVDHTFSSWA